MDRLLVSQNLRELRQHYNGNGISFEKLAEALQQRYNCKISTQTLKNYESAAINDGSDYVSKGNSIAGMKIDYLFMFADFYGVPADWILGLTKHKARDITIQNAAELTGLSSENITFLHKVKGSFIARIINFVLDDARLDDGNDRTLVKLLRFFLDYDGGAHASRRINVQGDILETPIPKNGLRTDAIMLDESIIENAVLDEIKTRLVAAKRGDRSGKH